MYLYLAYESFKCFCSMLFHVSLSSSQNIILLAEYVLSWNIPHLRSSWHLWQLWQLWVHVEWSNVLSINMCCPIKLWKNQPATKYQFGIRPYGKPEISTIITLETRVELPKTKKEKKKEKK